MQPSEDLICAYALGSRGKVEPLDWDGVRAHEAGKGLLWVHLQRRSAGTTKWLQRQAELDTVVSRALLSDNSRPRCEKYDDGVLLSLRCINLNPGAEPEDMIRIDLWMEDARILTVRGRQLYAISTLREEIEAGDGPRRIGTFVSRIVDLLAARIDTVISDLDDQIHALEEAMVSRRIETVRHQLSDVRREVIGLRRYAAPQRDAIAGLLQLSPEWLRDQDRANLNEVLARLTRYVEDLDAARERAQVIHDELATRVAEQMNRNMYVLSIVAAVFLPLGLVTGVLGANMGGTPGRLWPGSFFALSGVLVVLAGFEVWLFRRLKWI